MAPLAILLAFANDWIDDRRHLRNLIDEGKAIEQSLAPLVQSGALLPRLVHNATVEEVLAAFREPRYRRRIRMFHFAGHASSTALWFEDRAGAPSRAHAGGLAGYLGRQRSLVLVFLNGCSTQAQVRQLREAGVKAVVATRQSIRDDVAAAFAATFYAELAARPLRDAFETTAQAIRSRYGEDRDSVLRDTAPGDDHDAALPPWSLECDRRFDAWRLDREIARARRHMWRDRALAVVFAAALISAIASLAVRRTTSGCKTGGVATLGPPADIALHWTVNKRLADPLASDELARRDALERGRQDAEDNCAGFRRTGELLSARAEPRRWTCAATAAGFACGFDGEIVCRVRPRLVSDAGACR